MNNGMNEIVLKGCQPIPVSSYLKALGILRLVATQKDQAARGFWNEDDNFVLVTKFTKEEIVEFFLNEYKPSPMSDPWNGGSGFYKREDKATGMRTKPTKATMIVDEIISSKGNRLEQLRDLLTMTRSILSGLGYTSSPSGDAKTELLSSLRSSLPDKALDWLDASTVLGDSPSYPALLGTGGNDGNLDFANNYYQRLFDVFAFDTGEPTPFSQIWLDSTLGGKAISGLTRGAAIGQFNPGSSGGLNSTAGFDDQSVVNPWEYILMIEGALVFASAAVRRLDSDGNSTYSSPFAVRPNRAAYSGKSESEKIRAEIWFPLWRGSSSYKEIYHLFAEGRATVKRRKARDSLDIAIAVATMGVDRGISDFERYSFIERNGNNYFATSLGRFKVQYNAEADILEELHNWLRNIRTGPGSVRSAAAKLEEQMIQFCRTGGKAGLRNLLISAGASERALINSSLWSSDKSYSKPLLLTDRRWLFDNYDGSVEYRLAAALAACRIDGFGSIRMYCEPIELRGKYPKFKKETRLYVKHNELFLNTLGAVMKKILRTTAQKGNRYYPVQSRVSASSEDVSAFINGEVSDDKLMRLFNGLLLFDWYSFKDELPWDLINNSRISGVWATLKLAHSPYTINETKIPLETSIQNLAYGGNLNKATEKAARRLLGSGVPTVVNSAGGSAQLSKRMAAALLFPLSFGTTCSLRRMITNTEEISEGK